MRTLIFAFMLFFLSCSKSDSGNARFNNYVKVNECTYYAHPAGTREICLDSVLYDNRCDPRVICLTAGEAVCRFRVTRNGSSQLIELTTNRGASGRLRERDVFDLHIKLESLTWVDAYKDYEATLTITPL